MAYNQYNQRMPPQPSRGQYQGQPHPNGWSNGGRQYYENGYEQEGQSYGDRDYSEPAANQYGQYARSNEHAEDTYRQAQQGYDQLDDQSHNQQQSHQQYQYDPRYRSQGQPLNGQMERWQDSRELRGREKERPPQIDQKAKSKSRERILPAMVSPVVVAWDNPFPVFNPKKKDGKKKHSSLDKDMSKMNMTDQLDSQPQTSQSHRRGDEPRPHTSQGHRRPEPQLNSPGLSSSHVMSPIDRPVEGRNIATSNQRNFSDGQRPVRPPLNPLGSGRSIASFQGEPVPRLQQSQRSMTLPDDTAGGMTKKKLHKNPFPQNSRQPSGNKNGPPEPYNYVPSPISPVPSPNIAQQAREAAMSPRNALVSPEMPNFDAISPSANERTEDPLHVQTENTKPAYQKTVYQASVNGSGLPRSQSQSGSQHDQGNQPNFAGFTFDLPEDSNSTRYTNEQHFQVGSNQASPQSYNSRSPVAGPSSAHRSRPRGEQHPSRSAGRQGYEQPRSVSTTEGYGGAAVQQAQYRSASDAQQYPSRSQSRSANHDPAYDYGVEEYNEGAGSQQGYPGEAPSRFNQQPSQDAHRFYREQREYPLQIDTRQDPFNALQQQRSQTPTSVHPPPSRQYHTRKNSASINPDALPAHPVPVRPGLLQEALVDSPAMVQGSTNPYLPPPNVPGTMAKTLQEEEPPPVTKYDLNRLLHTIKNNPNDHKAALILAKKLVEAATTLSNEGGKADAKTAQKNRERYMFDAHKYLKKLVHQGYPDAMFYLAECHGQGSLGLQVDAKEAFRLYTSAAKAGHAQAAYRVAVCCEMGNEEGGGTRRDPIKAMHWYKRAASMGDTPAMYKFGIILLKGLLGQPRNPREAVSWLERAAKQADKENPHALHELGLLYENASPTDSIVKDENYSRQLFTQAAELGYKFSQFRLGSAYEYGMLGCPIDPRQSIGWYTRAAAQGEHQSELALSGWYLTGSEGILQQSDTEAYLWARKAANSRLAKAEYAMGYFTEVGIGCTTNLDEAKKWYWRAASQNFPKARQRLEDLKRGGTKMSKTRVSRSAFNRQNEGECTIM